MKKTAKRLAALLASLGLVCLCSVPVWADGIGTMDPINWDGYISDPNYYVEGDGDSLSLSKNTPSGRLTVTSYLHELGESEWTCAQMLRADVALPEAYWTVLPDGAQYTYTSLRYADESELETNTFESRVAHAEGSFSDFQGEDRDAIPTVSWSLDYSISVCLISEAWYPSALFYETGVLPDLRSGEELTPQEAALRQVELERQGVSFHHDEFDGKPCVITTERSENNDTGTREVFIPTYDGITIGTVGGSTSGGKNSTKIIGYTITDYTERSHYYLIDPLPQCPGSYAVVDLEILDCYRDEQNGAEMTFPQAHECISEYQSRRGDLFGSTGDLLDVEMSFSWVGQGDFSHLKPPTEQFEPVTQNEILTNPPENPGEFEGSSPIRKVIIVGAGGALAAAGATAGGSSGKRKEEEEEEETTFRMLLNKDFGNRLKKGEPPRAVGARIVEVTKSGKRIEHPELTERIRVSSADDSLLVTDGGMKDDWKLAMASVPEDCTFTEGLVTFTLDGPGGTFTQSVMFLLAEARIVFAQDNMGLPANCLKYAEEDASAEESRLGDGVFRLPFLVSDMGEEGKGTLKDLKVTAKLEKDGVTDVNGKAVKANGALGVPYSVEIVRDKEHPEAGLFEAVIREVLEYELPAGTTEGITLTVTAELGAPGSEQYEKIEGKFPVFRIHLGLAITLQESSVGCYMQLRKEREGIEQEKIKPSDLEPCFTDGSALLFRYLKKDLSIVRIPVVLEDKVKVTVKRLENDRYCHVGDADASHQALVDALGIAVISTGELLDNGARKIRVCSTEGALDPPTRMIADLEFTAIHKKKTFTFKKENVLLRSQPFRVAESMEESMAQIKRDAEIGDKLARIKSLVYDRHMDHLAALYNLIDRMQDGYDSRFGYDENQVMNVFRIWVGYVEGSFLGANAETEPVTLADELNACYAFMQGLRDNTGILGRIAMGVMTGGYSEYVFTTMTLAEQMREQVFACTGDKEFGFWDGVVMGVKEFEKQILLEYAMKGIAKGTNLYIAQNTGYNIGNQLSRFGRKYNIFVTKLDRQLCKNVKVYNWANNGFKGLKNYYNSTAATLRNSIEGFKKSAENAKGRAQQMLQKARKNLTPEELKGVEEYEKAMEEGMNKVRRLQKAQQKMERASSIEELKAAKEDYRQIANEVWTDKNALKQLQRNQHPYAQRMRAQFNHYRENLLDTVQLEALEDISKEMGIPRDQLYVMNASNGVKTDYVTGKKVPGDRDISFKQKVLSDRSKDLTINQSTGQKAVARRLYRKMNGREPDSIEEALDFMLKKDVTYVHPEGDSAISYVFDHNLDGYEDLAGMVGMKVDGTMDKSLLKKDLHNKLINQASVTHKGKEWFAMSKDSLGEAARLEGKAALMSGVAKESVLAQARSCRFFAQGQTVEGVRQITKQVEKIIIPRGVARSGANPIPPEALRLHELALRVGDDIAPAEFTHILSTEYGMDLYSYADYMSQFLD